MTQTEYSKNSDVQFVVVDVETHKTIHYEDKKLLGIAIAYSVGENLHTDYILPENREELFKWLDGKEIICHNAAFDLRILEENGFPIPETFWDTMVMAHLVNENRFSFELDSLAKIYLREQKMDISQFEKIFGGWENIPVDIMGAYARKDAELTYKLFVILRGKLEEQDLLKVWKHSKEYILTLKSVMSVGLPIDWPLAHAMSCEAGAEMNQIARTLGFHPSKKKLLSQALFKTFDPVLFTASGQPSLDDPALRYYAERYPEVNDLVTQTLRYRNLQKADGTWYRGFEKVRTPSNRIHPGLKQHGTVTGRLSCAKPNLQQLPRKADRVKKLFLPDENYELLEFDYSQIELRLASFYSQHLFDEETMFKAYSDAIDVHQLTTDSVGATDRQVGKTGNFLWVYGGSAKRFRSMMYVQYKTSVSMSDAIRWTNGFHNTYPGFRLCSNHFTEQAEGRGYVKLWNGRRRHFRYRADAHKAWNSIIQGGCGIILMMSMNSLRKAQEQGKIQSRMCNSVHDSIWFMTPKDQVEEEVIKIQEIMRRVPEKLCNLPFLVDVKPVYAAA